MSLYRHTLTGEIRDHDPAALAAHPKAALWEPYEAPPPGPAPVPEAVTPRQIRRALNAAGLRATVEVAVAQAPQDVRDDWEFALEIRRDHPELNAMALALGLTSEQLDALFIAAAAIE